MNDCHGPRTGVSVCRGACGLFCFALQYCTRSLATLDCVRGHTHLYTSTAVSHHVARLTSQVPSDRHRCPGRVDATGISHGVSHSRRMPPASCIFIMRAPRSSCTTGSCYEPRERTERSERQRRARAPELAATPALMKALQDARTLPSEAYEALYVSPAWS